MSRQRLHMRRTLVPRLDVYDDVVPLETVERERLATLMLESYLGTIDYEGEDFDDALIEINATLSGQYGDVITEACGALVENNAVVSAIIVTLHNGTPLIGYVFTAPPYQHRGLATRLIEHACAALAGAGWSFVDLFVTVGSPGEPLYRRLGFEEVAR